VNDYYVDLCIAITELNPDDKLMSAKIAALMKANSIIQAYASRMFDNRLLRAITEKKIAYIKEAKSIANLKEILGPPKICYRNGKIHPDGAYNIPEEEAIMWSLTSLRGGTSGLNRQGYERLKELMKQLYPEHEFVKGWG